MRIPAYFVVVEITTGITSYRMPFSSPYADKKVYLIRFAIEYEIPIARGSTLWTLICMRRTNVSRLANTASRWNFSTFSSCRDRRFTFLPTCQDSVLLGSEAVPQPAGYWGLMSAFLSFGKVSANVISRFVPFLSQCAD